MREWNEREPRTARTQNRKKKTGKWCKGKPGVEHVTEVVINHNVIQPRCQWSMYFTWTKDPKWRWACAHATRCINCGKYIDYLGLGERCPNYAPREEA